MGFELLITLSIFIVVLLLFSLEWLDKAVAVLSGCILLLVLKIIDFHDVISFIDFETLFLLFGMMLLVDTAKASGVFSWLNLKLTEFTAGNPFLILFFFSLITVVFSAFLDNVTTIIIVLPITIALTRAMGLNPKLYIIFEIIFSNIGGTLTLIGDPPNILIGSALGFSFMDFVYNLWIPILAILIVVFAAVVYLFWDVFKPINDNIPKLFVSNLLIKKVKYQSGLQDLNKPFMFKAVFVLCLTMFNFLFPDILGLEPGFIAIGGAMLLLILCLKEISIDKALHGIEWSTLLFFGGLFVLVGALGKVGVLEYVSDFVVNSSDSFFGLSMMVMWFSGIISAFIDNVPFVALMIPVLQDVIASGTLDPNMDQDLLWWSLSLGACLGGNGTLIGASANLVAIGIAKKEGIHISFLEFFKYGILIMFVSLIISSIYMYFQIF